MAPLPNILVAAASQHVAKLAMGAPTSMAVTTAAPPPSVARPMVPPSVPGSSPGLQRPMSLSPLPAPGVTGASSNPVRSTQTPSPAPPPGSGVVRPATTAGPLPLPRPVSF